MLLPHDDLGAGPAIVLLHAGIADRRMWAGHLPPLAEAGYRAVAMDLPAFGDAPPPLVDAAWLDVLETMDALGVERAALVGNSFGGAVALRAAVLAPQRCAALVLVSAPPPELQPSSELRAAWDAEESALARGDIEGAVHAVVDAWLPAGAPAAMREQVAAMQRRAFEIQAAADEATEAPDPLEAQPGVLATLDVPALVAAGELDMPDFIDGAERLARELPRARHEVILGAGHVAPLERPEAFRELLLGFLRESAP